MVVVDFFFPKVVDLFSEGKEEELTEVFRRLWLSLIFFLDVVDVFFRGRRGRRRLRFLGEIESMILNLLQ